MLEIFIFFQKSINLECKTQHAVITHANTKWYKNPNFFWKKLGMMLYLSNASLIESAICHVRQGNLKSIPNRSTVINLTMGSYCRPILLPLALPWRTTYKSQTLYRGFSRRCTHPVRAPSRAPCWIFWNNKICFNFVSILFEKIKLTVSERT